LAAFEDYLGIYMPWGVMINMIEPLFTLKLRYGLELVSDPFDRDDNQSKSKVPFIK